MKYQKIKNQNQLSWAINDLCAAVKVWKCESVQVWKCESENIKVTYVQQEVEEDLVAGSETTVDGSCVVLFNIIIFIVIIY